MRDLLGMSADECTGFRGVEPGELDSYLIEITRDISAYKDTEEAAYRQNTRHGGPEGHRQVDGYRRADEKYPLANRQAVFARCLSA